MPLYVNLPVGEVGSPSRFEKSRWKKSIFNNAALSYEINLHQEKRGF
jgi:hypothetical protein